MQDTAKGIAELQNRFLTGESREILAWLSPLDFWTNQDHNFSLRFDGTGQWFLEDHKFKKWLSGPPITLWCPGMRMASPFCTLDAMLTKS